MKKLLSLITIGISSCLIFGCSSESTPTSTYTVPAEIVENMSAPTTTQSFDVTEEMLSAGIFESGSNERVARVMEKAGSGEPVTIAYIGGSITQGCNASPMSENCYAALSTNWWRETFPDTEITYVNAGIGATDSYLGVHRVCDDVLSKNPDLVVVEFSVNDYQNWNKETYESLVRTILDYETAPAVISLLLTQDSGYDYATEHTLVAFNYSLPVISYKAAYAKSGLSWSDIGGSDQVHPSNAGHELIANLLTNYYCSVLSSINSTFYEEYTLPDSTLTKCRFENADILYSDEIKATSMDGFKENTIATALTNNNGWSTTDGGSISFTLEAKTIGVIYQETIDGKGGQFDFYVDGEKVTLLNADATGSWGDAVCYADGYKSDTVGSHTITISLNEDSANTTINILGIAVSN